MKPILLACAYLLVVCPVSLRGVTYGQRIVAAVLMAEAWGEGEVGMTAVAEVIRTRANESKISPLAVVTSYKQFSCLNSSNADQLYSRFARLRDYRTALAISRKLYNQPEALPGYSKGANHFTRSVEKPAWAQGQHPVVVIGNHAFYRL